MITEVFNSPMVSTDLCKIMGANKSDKGHEDIFKSWHNYTIYYYMLFKGRREQSLRVFELGLGTNNVNMPSNMGADGRPGASLYGWSEFFTNAEIYGADIDRAILFDTDKIKTFYCDQTNPTDIRNLWDNASLKEQFDIIVEDGLHKYEANVIFFENSIHKLKTNGYYIIEDIQVTEIPLFAKKVDEWKIRYPHLTFTMVNLVFHNTFDNNLLVVKA